MQRNPITPEGYEVLVADLKNHKSVLRPQNVRDIEEARAHGDISENAEFEAAKERQSMLEARISHLEMLAAAAEIIDVARLPRNGRVVFGTTVVLESPESGEEREYRIVGTTESDVKAGKISYTSPLAQALIGHSEGEEVTVVTPGGRQVWEIIEVKYI
ncbi:MAG: transcription elongation factor GreA [Deltaproteobacteria bacterium]|nr:transcription elongation factor GreA [Deltaproteobacteria bacterium]